MDQITNQELLCKLETIIKKNTSEIKAEIKSINDTLNQKLENLEKKYSKIEEKIVYIERENKKNNIVIFGITTDWYKSAPSTPTTTHHSSKELEDTPSISEIPDVTGYPRKRKTNTIKKC
ncbi:hypothetical protein JTB14_000492 [Gonioctena quinquepunctata]|nr:hypothetical protein JTB14_000492 [Gonioctena quinquepunctata]